MLVIKRKLNEAICIGSDIRIVTVDIRKNNIRLGIEAPLNTPILREEILLEQRRVKEESEKSK